MQINISKRKKQNKRVTNQRVNLLTMDDVLMILWIYHRNRMLLQYQP